MSLRPDAPVLTSADHEHFLEHGYVVVKGVVSPATIAAALDVLDGEAGRREAADDTVRRDAAIAACLTPTVFAAIAELFGPDYPFEHTRHANDMPRRYEPGAVWTMQGTHADEDYATVMPGEWAVFVFVFLTPVRTHGGAFLYAPGSAYRYRPGLADNCEWTNYLGWTAQPELSGPVHEFLAKPGDLLIYHHNLGHTGSNNVSDPRTRHALRAGFHPRRRIVPARKPFAEMSTIEKANSARYLQHRFGAPHRLPDLAIDERSTRALRDGFATPGGIVAHTVLRFEGLTHLFYVDGAEPTTIRHARSANWVDWETEDRLLAEGSAIESLHIIHDAQDVILLAGTAEGDGQTHLFTSRDLRHWSSLAVVPGCRSGSGHYSVIYGRGTYTIYNVIVYVAPQGTPAVQIRRGNAWADAAAWEVVPAAASPHREILDAFVKPLRSGEEFALVADVREPAGGSPRPFYALSSDSMRYTEPLQALSYTTPTPPRHLRVYARARRYWLLTHRRRVEGQERLFWGTIDWDKEPLTLEEIESAMALDDALYVIGLQ